MSGVITVHYQEVHTLNWLINWETQWKFWLILKAITINASFDLILLKIHPKRITKAERKMVIDLDL